MRAYLFFNHGVPLGAQLFGLFSAVFSAWLSYHRPSPPSCGNLRIPIKLRVLPYRRWTTFKPSAFQVLHGRRTKGRAPAIRAMGEMPTMAAAFLGRDLPKSSR